jgi:hypothetical protein
MPAFARKDMENEERHVVDIIFGNFAVVPSATPFFLPKKKQQKKARK